MTRTRKTHAETNAAQPRHSVGRLVRPVVGICDFCGEEAEVVDLGQMGVGIIGFSACRKCHEDTRTPWPNK